MPILARLILAAWCAILVFLLVDSAFSSVERVSAAVEQSMRKAHGF